MTCYHWTKPSPKRKPLPFALKEQVAQRLAQHRARRTQSAPGRAPSNVAPTPTRARASRIAAAVAERYANSQSYRAFLAEQAEAAIRQAEAAAQIAALNAQAVADAQNQLLDELDQWALIPTSQSVSSAPPRITEADTFAPAARLPIAPTAPLTVKLYAEEQVVLPQSELPVISKRFSPEAKPDESEALALEEEIAFRQAPVFEDMGPPIDIPANLIEFPRQLVAPRKARPRLAEGPLREEADHATHQDPQYRSTTYLRGRTRPDLYRSGHRVHLPGVVVHRARRTTRLHCHPGHSRSPLPAHPGSSNRVLQPAPHGQHRRRLHHWLRLPRIHRCLCHHRRQTRRRTASAPRITPQIAAITAAVTLLALTFFYQFLFFTFSEATPGMRYARIGLCTLSDDNPTRSAMRRRILATALAACPLGIGFLWAWFDDDGLGWHDRISRMYQRAY